MTGKNQFLDDLQKAITDVDTDLQKAMKKGTNAKREVVEGEESEEEKEKEGEENEDEEDEKNVEKAMAHLKKKGYKGHEADETEEKEMEEELKEKGHSSKVIKSALKKYCGSSLKKSLAGDELNEEVIDATEILKGFVDSQNDIEKSLNAQTAKMDALIKSTATFGKALSYIMEQVNAIAETPIKKSLTGAKAVQKSFDQPIAQTDETVIDIDRDRSLIIKALKTEAYHNPTDEYGMKVKNPKAVKVLQEVLRGDATSNDLYEYKSLIEKSLNKTFSK